MGAARCRHIVVAGLAALSTVMAAGVASAGVAAARSAGAPPYDAAAGQDLVSTAEQIIAGDAPWARGCQSPAAADCVPYSWAGGHDSTPGPSQGRCQDGWTRPKHAPADLYSGPACKDNHNKDKALNGRFGLDCSGFTRWVYYLVYGKDVLGSGPTSSQPRQDGMVHVPGSDRKPGDLLFYPGHVGIYIGSTGPARQPVILDEPHAYNQKAGTSGQALSDWLVAYGRRNKVSKADAAKASYYRYTGKPAAPVDVVKAASGPGDGAVLGPDGRVWIIGPYTGITRATSVEAVNPVTRKVSVYQTKPAFDIFTGPPAFDGHGDVWLGGEYNSIARMNLATRATKTFALPRQCGGIGNANVPGGLYSGDGDIWVECGGASGDTLAVRVSPSGQMSTPVQPPAKAPQLGPLTEGPGGSMWAVGYSAGFSDGVVRIADGKAGYFPETQGLGAINIAGNGTGDLIEQGYCPGTFLYCYESVAKDGARTMLVERKNVLNSLIQYPPGLDSGGNAWMMVALTATSWAYYEVSLSGSTDEFKFKMPASNGYAEPLNPPVTTADGALWMEMGRNPDYLLRIAPGQ